MPPSMVGGNRSLSIISDLSALDENSTLRCPGMIMAVVEAKHGARLLVFIGTSSLLSPSCTEDSSEDGYEIVLATNIRASYQ